MKNSKEQNEKMKDVTYTIDAIDHKALNPDPETFENRWALGVIQDLEELECEDDTEEAEVLQESENDSMKFFGLETHRNDLDEK